MELHLLLLPLLLAFTASVSGTARLAGSTPKVTVTWVIPKPGSADYASDSSGPQLKKKSVKVKTVVAFKWSDIVHNLYQFTNQAAFKACDFKSAKLIKGDVKSATVSVTMPASAGTFYYGCSVGADPKTKKGGHCLPGHKIIIATTK